MLKSKNVKIRTSDSSLLIYCQLTLCKYSRSLSRMRCIVHFPTRHRAFEVALSTTSKHLLNQTGYLAEHWIQSISCLFSLHCTGKGTPLWSFKSLIVLYICYRSISLIIVVYNLLVKFYGFVNIQNNKIKEYLNSFHRQLRQNFKQLSFWKQKLLIQSLKNL